MLAILRMIRGPFAPPKAYDAADPDGKGENDQLFAFLEKLDCLLCDAHGEGFLLVQKGPPRGGPFCYDTAAFPHITKI